MTQAALRLLWTIIGLLLTAVGAVGLAANLGHLPGTDIDAPLLWSGLLGLWRNTAPWGLVVAALIGLLLAGLGGRLLGRLLRAPHSPAAGELTLTSITTATSTVRHAGHRASPVAPPSVRPGRTRIRGLALAHGLERDLASDPEVRRASVTLVGEPPQPEVWIQLYVGSSAQVGSLRAHVSAAVHRFATTSGLHPRYLDVTARIDHPRHRQPR